MDNNFQVRKAVGAGWDVIDTRLGEFGTSVDWTNLKRDAVARCSKWNKVNPQPKTKTSTTTKPKGAKMPIKKVTKRPVAKKVAAKKETAVKETPKAKLPARKEVPAKKKAAVKKAAAKKVAAKKAAPKKKIAAKKAAPKKEKGITKHQFVIDLLKRKGGATRPQIEEAMMKKFGSFSAGSLNIEFSTIAKEFNLERIKAEVIYKITD
jgi:hypothetical protein